jgi:hypothetical protein
MNKALQQAVKHAGIVAIIGLLVMAVLQSRDKPRIVHEPAVVGTVMKAQDNKPAFGRAAQPDLTPEEQQLMEHVGVLHPTKQELIAIMEFYHGLEGVRMGFAGKAQVAGEWEAAEKPVKDKLIEAIGEERAIDVIAITQDNGYRELLGKGVDRGILAGWLSLWELSRQMPSPLSSREKERRAKDILGPAMYDEFKLDINRWLGSGTD